MTIKSYQPASFEHSSIVKLGGAAENWKKNLTAVWAQPTKLQQAWLDENYKLK
jgi:hypothetical protein